ncbi:MAG: ATP-binding cassette domain-containing protein [Treponema sp.]|nr:ATP-binding cassette domain-containing protein [Treponema sp.]
MKISLSSIKMQFSYKTVLDGVDCSFEEGQIHALIGENGQGKSTLARIICGEIKPTQGTIFLDGEPFIPENVHEAIEQGIFMVRQRPLLADSVSIRENLLLGMKSFNNETALSILKSYCPNLTLGVKVFECTGDQRFFISLTGALLKNPKILILDEPSALLTPDQTKNLYKSLEELAAKGMNIIVITHFPEELKYAHTVTKLSGGKAYTEKDDFASSTPSDINSRENSQASVIRLVFPTLSHLVEEENRLAKQFPLCSYIPSDKTFRGSHPQLTISQLLTACYKGPWKNRRTYIENIISSAQIQILPSEKVAALSGGMLQRLILERELAKNSSTVIMAEPFQGLDTERTIFMKNRIDQLAAQGKTVYVLETGAPQ